MKTLLNTFLLLGIFTLGLIGYGFVLWDDARANEERYVQGLKDLHWARGMFVLRDAWIEIHSIALWENDKDSKPVASLSVYP